MKSYPSLNSDAGCGNGWSSICYLCVALALDVKHHRFLALCIRRTPVLSVKICVKSVSYTRENTVVITPAPNTLIDREMFEYKHINAI